MVVNNIDPRVLNYNLDVANSKAASGRVKALDDAMKIAADIANEANFLWNDNIDKEKNRLIRDTAWIIHDKIKKLKI